MSARWSILTPGGHGAIAIVRIESDDAAATAAELGLGGLRARTPSLRDLLGVDHGVAVLWDARTLELMPHGGPAVVRALVRALEHAGVAEAEPTPAIPTPRTPDDLDAAVAAALTRAASPAAVDLLLDQPRRWRASGLDATDVADARALAGLIEPPLVVALGPPNIGKSTLLNALAGERAALVADMPGTTRDHVGVTLDLSGVVVTYLDTPGVRDAGRGGGRAGAIEAEAAGLAIERARGADLLLLCGDARTPPVGLGELGLVEAGIPAVRVALRADLGEAGWEHDAAVAIPPGEAAAGSPARSGSARGIVELARLIRERLVPAFAIADPRPWRFWGEAAGLSPADPSDPVHSV